MKWMVQYVQKTQVSNFCFQYSFQTSERFCKNRLGIKKCENEYIFQFLY